METENLHTHLWKQFVDCILYYFHDKASFDFYKVFKFSVSSHTPNFDFFGKQRDKHRQIFSSWLGRFGYNDPNSFFVSDYHVMETLFYALSMNLIQLKHRQNDESYYRKIVGHANSSVFLQTDIYADNVRKALTQVKQQFISDFPTRNRACTQPPNYQKFHDDLSEIPLTPPSYFPLPPNTEP
jgi:hypothetical protein